eukprot:7480213-Alexandrium_andersonii.AAC.1
MTGAAEGAAPVDCRPTPWYSTIRYGARVRVATLNARSLMKPAMQHQVEQYMSIRNIHILLLQETRVPTTSQFI